jgi:hypothetical protein
MFLKKYPPNLLISCCSSCERYGLFFRTVYPTTNFNDGAE